MKILGTFFMGLLGSLLGFFGKYLSQKLVVGATAITFFAALFTTFFVAIQSMLSTIVYTVSNSFVLTAIQMLWPPHVSVCISIMMTATISHWVYEETKDRAKTVLQIT
jgi:hypothetical protein